MFNAGSGLSAQIVDLGHTYIRSGYAGEDLPRTEEEGNYVADKQWKYDNLSEALKKVLDEISDSPVLVTENGAESARHREWLVSEIFENFRTPAVFVARRPVAAAYAQGKVSTHVLHAGGTTTQYSIVTSGWLAQTEIIWVGGNQVDLEIAKHLPSDCRSPINFARQLKEEVCRVGNSSQKFPAFSAPVKLPDGTVVDSGLFAYAPELLFPSPFFASEFPVTSAVDVVLCGGASLTTNYAVRAQAELGERKLVRVFSQGQPLSEQRHAAFLGASILGSLGAFPNLMVSRAEFLEYGPGVVHKKCP